MNTFQLNGVPIAIHVGDEDIAKMCAEHAIAFTKPAPPADTCIVAVEDNGWFWIVLRFYHEDGGYAAFGVPTSAPLAHREVIANMALEAVQDSARAAGVDAGFTVHPLGSVKEN